jgi:5-amino-6-(5-phosphoribosylamino)uracil reductase
MRIMACFAATLDGKIGSVEAPRDRVGSRADLDHLFTIRNQADALLYGGETFRHHPLLRKGNAQSTPPLQCLLTQSFNMPPDAPLFQDSLKQTPASPIIIASPTEAPPEVRARYLQQIEWVTTGAETVNPIPQMLSLLEQRGIRTLLVEGGGHILNLCLQAKVIDELYLTVCPLLLGGPQNPTLVGGLGSGFRVGEAPRTEVLSSEWKAGELYLHLKVTYPDC